MTSGGAESADLAALVEQLKNHDCYEAAATLEALTAEVAGLEERWAEFNHRVQPLLGMARLALDPDLTRPIEPGKAKRLLDRMCDEWAKFRALSSPSERWRAEQRVIEAARKALSREEHEKYPRGQTIYASVPARLWNPLRDAVDALAALPASGQK